MSGGEGGASSAEVLCRKEERKGEVSTAFIFAASSFMCARRSLDHIYICRWRQLHALHHTHERRRIAGGHTRLAVHQPGDMFARSDFQTRGGEGGRVRFGQVRFSTGTRKNEREIATACLRAPWSDENYNCPRKHPVNCFVHRGKATSRLFESPGNAT